MFCFRAKAFLIQSTTIVRSSINALYHTIHLHHGIRKVWYIVAYCMYDTSAGISTQNRSLTKHFALEWEIHLHKGTFGNHHASHFTVLIVCQREREKGEIE